MGSGLSGKKIPADQKQTRWMFWKMNSVSEPERLTFILLKWVKSKTLVLYSATYHLTQELRFWIYIVSFFVPLSFVNLSFQWNLTFTSVLSSAWQFSSFFNPFILKRQFVGHKDTWGLNSVNMHLKNLLFKPSILKASLIISVVISYYLNILVNLLLDLIKILNTVILT